MMQMRDEMSMLRYRSSNTFSCPMVIRTRDRRLPARRRAVPQPVGREHLRALPRHPHRRIPSNAQDAAGLLRTAIRCDDPVLFLEHKHLYRQTYNKGEYPGAGLHDSVRQGRRRSARAPTSSSSPGARWCSGRCSPRSRPRRTASARWSSTCARSCRSTGTRSPTAVKKTNRVVIAHEDQLTCGFGAEIAARVASDLFEYLDAPVRRVAAMDTPVAYCPDLEEVILPGSADVLAAIVETAKY